MTESKKLKKSIKKSEINKHNYIGEEEKGRQVLTLVDFSLAFPKTALGTALCITNPIEQNVLKNRCKSFDNQKRRMKLNTLIAQRLFFTTQILQKGLQSIKDKPVSPVPEPVVIHKVPDESFLITESNVNSTAIKFGHAMDKIKTIKQPIYERSQTLGFPISTATVASTFGKTSPRYGMMNKRMATLEDDHSEQIEHLDDNTDTNVIKKRQLRKQKRKLRSLQKDPSLMFPKMDTLLSEGYNVHQSKLPDIHLKNNRHKQSESIDNQNEENTNDNISNKKSTLRLVRKIAATLNCDISTLSARNRVREISQAQQAYIDKETYLKTSKKLLEREVITDKRWNALEGSLSETFGLTLNWRKLRGSKNWVVKPNELTTYDTFQYNY